MTPSQTQPTIDFSQVDLGDKRLNKRLTQFVETITRNAKQSIMSSAKGRDEAKAYYRMLGNEKLDMEQLLGIASGGALSRMDGTVLLIQDTSDINLNGHKKTKGLGYCSEHVRGVKLHSCIAVNPTRPAYPLVWYRNHMKHVPRPKASSLKQKKTRAL